jgi:hypothetical protein
MCRVCVGLRDMCDRQHEAMAATGYQLDAQRFAMEDVLLEELESWLDSPAGHYTGWASNYRQYAKTDKADGTV